jgi:hypothetical protein
MAVIPTAKTAKHVASTDQSFLSALSTSATTKLTLRIKANTIIFCFSYYNRSFFFKQICRAVYCVHELLERYFFFVESVVDLLCCHAAKVNKKGDSSNAIPVI